MIGALDEDGRIRDALMVGPGSVLSTRQQNSVYKLAAGTRVFNTDWRCRKTPTKNNNLNVQDNTITIQVKALVGQDDGDEREVALLVCRGPISGPAHVVGMTFSGDAQQIVEFHFQLLSSLIVLRRYLQC